LSATATEKWLAGERDSAAVLDRFLDSPILRIREEADIDGVRCVFVARWTTPWWSGGPEQRGAAVSVWVEAIHPASDRYREIYLPPGWAQQPARFVRALDRLRAWTREQVRAEQVRGIVMDLVQECRGAYGSPGFDAFVDAACDFRSGAGLRCYLGPITEDECRQWIGWLVQYGRNPTPEGSRCD
jgi:hypothetical protein